MRLSRDAGRMGRNLAKVVDATRQMQQVRAVHCVARMSRSNPSVTLSGSLAMDRPLFRRHSHRVRVRVRRVVVDALLDLVAEMADQALHRPGRTRRRAHRWYDPRPAW